MHLLKITKFKIIVSLIFIGQTIYLQGQATNSSYFITTWNTEAGDPGGTSFKLPLSGGAYDVDRNNDGDFDDANEANQTGTTTIDFGVGNAGRKTIAVRPNPTSNASKQLRISHFEGGDVRGTPLKLTSIDKWGDIVWTSMENAFLNCSNLTIADDAGVPNLTMVTDMHSTFARATNFNGNISNWNVSNVTHMSHMFFGASNFNGNISNWNVSNVTSMGNMFWEATSFNGDLSNWNVSNVTNMYQMFHDATSFNGDLSNWNVSNVANMGLMFSGATSFNGNISNWNVSNVVRMSNMFQGATSFNGNLSNWNVSNVTAIYNLFNGATSFNGNISNWNVSNIIYTNRMFAGATSFNGDLSNWNVSNVTGMQGTFRNATSFNGDLSTWNASNVTYMDSMFEGATSFNGNISTWDISNVTNMTDMLTNADGFSSENYDALLTGWSNLTPQNNITFGAPPTTYCSGKAGRDILINTYNWDIQGDNGLDCTAVTSVDEEFLSNTKIYPNSTNGKINIESSFEIDKLELYNVLGAKLFSVSKTNVLDLTSLRQGIYILKVFSGDKVFAKKVIKD